MGINSYSPPKPQTLNLKPVECPSPRDRVAVNPFKKLLKTLRSLGESQEYSWGTSKNKGNKDFGFRF